MKTALFLLALCSASYASDSVRAGAKLYSRHCSACHGESANGTRRAPSLRTLNVAPEELFRILTNGLMRGGMPSWSKLPPEQQRQIVAYLTSLEPAAANARSNPGMERSTVSSGAVSERRK